MSRPSAYAALTAAKESGRFSAGVLALLEALAPIAHWGELDGLPQHIANLFPEHERQAALNDLSRASSAFRKATAPKEE